MAATKLWAVRSNLKHVQDYVTDEEKTEISDLRSVMDYASNGEKTEHKYYVAGINCTPETAYEEFTRVKEKYSKTDGIIAYHGYMSFAQGEVTPDEAIALGQEFAEKMWGDKYQILLSVHLNTECVHCHFVVNSVSLRDGSKLRDNEKNWNYFKHVADEICKEHGKSVIYGDLPRQPTKRDRFVKNTLDAGIEQCSNIEELAIWLEKRGFKCDFSENHKYWTVIPRGWTKPYRLSHLNKVFNEDYSPEALYIKLAEEKSRSGDAPTPEKQIQIYRSRAAGYPTRDMQLSKSLGRLSRTLGSVQRSLKVISSRKPYQTLLRQSMMSYSRGFGYQNRYRLNSKPTWYKHNQPKARSNTMLNDAVNQLKFLSTYQCSSAASCEEILVQQKAKIKDLYKQKDLLEMRGQYEDVSRDLALIKSEIANCKTTISCAEHWIKEFKEEKTL